jgi:enoyl-CoA hydratase
VKKMGGQVRVEKENHIAVVTIDNPPLNVLGSQIFAGLDDAFSVLEADDEVVAILVTGAGNRAFVAGADIREFPEMMNNPDLKSQVMKIHGVMNRVDRSSKPTIAVLNGTTYGGGCELALACDIRIAEQQVQIGLPEVKLGLFPGGGGTQRLPRLIGEAKAKEMMFTGEPISADEALRIGLVNQVVPGGTGLDAAKELAEKIACFSLQSLSRIKKAVDDGLQESLVKGIEREADLFVAVFQTEDIHEGVSAFLEKRKPAFKHR